MAELPSQRGRSAPAPASNDDDQPAVLSKYFKLQQPLRPHDCGLYNLPLDRLYRPPFMLLQLAFISLLVSTLAAPSPRAVVGQLSPAERRQLTQVIALDLVVRGLPTDDPEELNENVDAYFGDANSPLRKRLFGWLAGSDSSYAPEKVECPADATFVRPATVSAVKAYINQCGPTHYSPEHLGRGVRARSVKTI